MYQFYHGHLNRGRTAMRITGQPGTSSPMFIFTNAIVVGEGGSSPALWNPVNCPIIDIEINQAGEFSLIGNTIYTSNTDLFEHRTRWGFYLHNWESPAFPSALSENHVIGNQAFFDHGMCAYHFDKTGPLTICDNTADYTLRGFHLSGDCATSIFAANHFGHHSRSNVPNDPSNPLTGALQMEVGSKLGKQACQHNIWEVANYAPDRGAWHKGANFTDTRFDYNPNLVGEKPSPIFPVSGWFFDECTNEPTGGHCGTLLYSTTLDEFEAKTVQENQSYTEPETVLAWEERRQLIAKLLRYPDLKTTYPLASTFYNVHLNTTAGQFAQFDEMLNNAILIAPNQMSSLSDIRNQITYWIGKVDSLDGTLANMAAVQNASNVFFYYRSTLLSHIGTLLFQQEVFENQIEAARNTALEQCSQYIATLPQARAYEINQKFLNELAIKKGQSISLSEGDYAMLRAIAAQCPELAGYTRERAMNWLPVGDPAIARPDVPYAPGCQGLYGEGEERSISQSETQLGIRLSPNPVGDILTIDFEMSFSGSIEVFDMTGRSTPLKRQIKAQTNLELPVDGLSPGIYILLAKADSGEFFALKFAVSK